MKIGMNPLAVLGTTMLALSLSSHTVATAHAEPVSMASQVYEKVSRDGWHLNIKIENELVNSVPNLAAAANSREGFVTASATATATGGSNPITDSLFILGYQLGCQSDVSAGLNLGGTAGISPQAGLGLGSGAPLGVSAGAAGGVAGFVQTLVQPGVIVELPMTNMALGPDGTAMLDIDNLHIKADACGGDVTIRSYAYLRVSTAEAHTQFAIYGDPTKI
jgi:MspA protein